MRIDRCPACELPVQAADREVGVCPWCDLVLEPIAESEGEAEAGAQEDIWMTEPLGRRKSIWILGIGMLGMAFMIGIGIWLELRPPAAPLAFAAFDPAPVPAGEEQGQEPVSETSDQTHQAISSKPDVAQEEDAPAAAPMVEARVEQAPEEPAVVAVIDTRPEPEPKALPPPEPPAQPDPAPVAKQDPKAHLHLTQQINTFEIQRRKVIDRMNQTRARYEQKHAELLRKDEQNTRKYASMKTQMRKRYAQLPESAREQRLRAYEKKVVEKNAKHQAANIKRNQDLQKKNIQRMEKQVREYDQKIVQVRKQLEKL